jgi:hypothetical protein
MDESFFNSPESLSIATLPFIYPVREAVFITLLPLDYGICISSLNLIWLLLSENLSRSPESISKVSLPVFLKEKPGLSMAKSGSIKASFVCFRLSSLCASVRSLSPYKWLRTVKCARATYLTVCWPYESRGSFWMYFFFY